VTGVDQSAGPAGGASAADFIQLTGVYRAGTVAVSAQSVGASNEPQPFLTTPPCPPPAGGWPQGSFDNLDFGPMLRYQQQHPDRIVQFAQINPSPTQRIAYALVRGDPTLVQAALAPFYGQRLCLAPSPYTTQQIATATASLVGDTPGSLPAGAWARSSGVDAAGAERITLELTQVTPALAERAALAPAGLIELKPWLVPVKH
jgi:hypothetical protein